MVCVKRNKIKITIPRIIVCIVLLILQLSCQRNEFLDERAVGESPFLERIVDDPSEEYFLLQSMSCARANADQISVVDRGNAKFDQFMKYCYEQTNNSPLCEQIVRPNPASRSIFECTYGQNQQHNLIHPDEKTWSHAIIAVNLTTKLQELGINILTIYNWWRPEPYNKNVGGARGRHPLATSVDIKFSSKNDQDKAHRQLCKWRRQGKIRAIGYYASNSIHVGIGDRAANTWGKSCP